MDGSQCLLLRSCPIVVGEGNQCSILVANTENIARSQCFAESFIATNFAPLIEQAVECALLVRAWVDKDELTALTDNLNVLVGNNSAIAHRDVIGSIPSDIDDIF